MPIGVIVRPLYKRLTLPKEKLDKLARFFLFKKTSYVRLLPRFTPPVHDKFNGRYAETSRYMLNHICFIDQLEQILICT